MPITKWVATGAANGRILANLPGLAPTGQLRRTMGRSESATFTLTVTDATDPNWELATREGLGSLYALVTDDDGADRVVWGGLVMKRDLSLGNTVTIAAATHEIYLDGRYTGAYVATGRDQNLMMADFVGVASRPVPTVPSLPGLPFQTVIVGAAGALRDRAYNDWDDKTVFAVMDELAHVIGGPQWLISWQRLHAPERIVPVVMIGTRLGNARMPGLAAPVAWSPKADVTGTLSRSWSAGANIVTATSTGSGTGVRPQSPPQAGTADGRPAWEYRFAPSTSITSTGTLTDHATAQLAQMRNGAQTLTFTASRATGPRLGIDFDLADDADVILDGPLFPTPLTVQGQIVSYDFDGDTVTPILATPGGF